MTSTVTETTLRAIVTSSFVDRSASISIVAVLLILALLVQKELFRAYNAQRAAEWFRVWDAILLPLLFMFGFTIVMRLLALL